MAKIIKQYSHIKQGHREDLDGRFFRSAWEANYARYLNFLFKQNVIVQWSYEADTFWFDKIKRGVRSYKPDFKIWENKDDNPYYVEVKGWMDPKSSTKLKRMKLYHPNIRLVLVDHKEYRKLSDTFSKIIKHWE